MSFIVGNKQVALYVPTTHAIDQPIDTSRYVNLVAKFFAVWFGGSTVSEVQGYYLADSGVLVKEKAFRVYAFTDSIDETTKQRILGLATLIKTRLAQESVAVELLEYQNEGLVFA